jgi:hypothetical protein
MLQYDHSIGLSCCWYLVHRELLEVRKKKHKKRKIISVYSVMDGTNLIIHAVCNDGTVWCNEDKEHGWKPVKNVPRKDK